jgi:hypothetical protein
MAPPAPFTRGTTAVAAGLNDPLTIWNTTDLTSAIGNLGYGWEDSVAAAPGAVFETGNYYSAYSADGGYTFTATHGLSEGGHDNSLPAGVNSQGADQVVIYAPQIGRFIWVRQARQAAGGLEGDYSIAVDTPAQIVASKGQTWNFMNLTPEAMNMGGRQCWFDYPLVGVSTHYLLLAFNNLCSTGGSTAIIARLKLSDLADGKLTGSFYTSQLAGTAPTAGGPLGSFGIAADPASSSPSFAGWVDNPPTTLRIFRWDDSSSAPTSNDIAVSTPADPKIGTNSAVGYRITGGAQTGETWFAWTSGPTGTMTQTHIEYVVVDASSLRQIGGERYIYDPNYPYSDPSLASNSNGEVGIAYAWGDRSQDGKCCALPGVGILTGKQVLVSAVNTNTKSAGSGFDYVTVRTDWADPRLFAAGTFYQLLPPGGPSNPGGDNHALFSLFGRYGDQPLTPPPSLTPPGAGPQATTGPAENIGTSGAIVTGTVNPEDNATTSYFEYGLTTGYGNTTSSTSDGSGPQPILVTSAITGLAPGTTYHYRIIANNPLGTAVGGDETFTTTSPSPPPGPLPDLAITSFTDTSFTVANQGARAAGAFSVSVTRGAPASDTLVFDYPSGLAPGQSSTQTFICLGDYTQTVTADPTDQVPEADDPNDTNNSATRDTSCLH